MTTRSPTRSRPALPPQASGGRPGRECRADLEGPRQPGSHARRLCALLLVALAVGLTGVPARAGAWPGTARAAAKRVALVRVAVDEGAGIYHAREHLTFGVPLARGRVADVSRLRAWRLDDDGALPIQARSLSSWPDGSVRWALVDTQLELQARVQLVVAVGLADDIAADDSPWSLAVDDSNGGLVLRDGPRQRPVLTRGLRGDAVGGLRARLVDRFGHEYRADVARDAPLIGPGEPLSVADVPALAIETEGDERSNEAWGVEWLEWGPLRATARIRGGHRAVDDEGLPIDFYSFTAYVHYLAGKPLVRVEWSLENGPLEDPPGRLAFRSYDLVIDPSRVPDGIDVSGHPSHDPVPFRLRQDGPLPTNYDYEVNGRDIPKGRGGDLWAGVLDERDRKAPRGTYVHMVDSAGNHPSELSYAPSGELVLGLLPPAPGDEYFLDDASRKTFRLDVAWNVNRAGRAAMLGATRPTHVTLDARDVARSKAWGDSGLFYVPRPGERSRPVPPPRDPPSGWADLGEWRARNTHSTGSPRNRLSVYLEAVQSGRQELYELARLRAYHAMDLRPYHIIGFSADEYPGANLFEGVPHPNEKPERSLGRKGMKGLYPDYKRDLPSKGHGYNGFDPEHMTLDDVYECYLLTGSWIALDALRSAGEAMLTWRWVKDYLHSSRAFGWTLRALVQVHRATGDPRYIEAARKMVTMAEAERGKGEVKYLRKSNKKDKRHIEDQESESPWMVAVAMHGLCAYYDVTGDERVPPMLADLTAFCLSGLRDNGFVADIPIGGPATGGEVHHPTGTSQWVPGAIGAAAFVTGDHAPVDAVYPYYRFLTENSSEPTRFGADSWHWWQPYLLSLEQRHGETAVGAPDRFRPPPPEGR